MEINSKKEEDQGSKKYLSKNIKIIQKEKPNAFNNKL